MKAPVLLIVDDEADITATYSLLFELEGFEVLTANDGHDALGQVARRRPDLVITDFMMPRMNGLRLCERLRENDQTRAIPLILSSALRPPTEGPTPPYDHFVPKPVDFLDLLQTVRGSLCLTR